MMYGPEKSDPGIVERFAVTHPRRRGPWWRPSDPVAFGHLHEPPRRPRRPARRSSGRKRRTRALGDQLARAVPLSGRRGDASTQWNAAREPFKAGLSAIDGRGVEPPEPPPVAGSLVETPRQ
jgi:hypothetical protein